MPDADAVVKELVGSRKKKGYRPEMPDFQTLLAQSRVNEPEQQPEVYPDRLDPDRPKIGVGNREELRQLMADLAADEAKARPAPLPEDPASQLGIGDKILRGLVDGAKVVPGPQSLWARLLDRAATGPNVAAGERLASDVASAARPFSPALEAVGDAIPAPTSAPERAGLSLTPNRLPPGEAAPPAANTGPSALDGADAEGALVPEFERKSPGVSSAAAPLVQQQRSAMDELVSIYQRLSDEQRGQATQLVNEIEAQKPSVFSPQNLLFLIAFGPQFLAQHWQRENQEWSRRMDMAKQRLMQIASGTQTGMAREMGQFARQQERAGQRRPPLVSDPQFRRYFAAKYGKDPATAGPGDTVVIPEQRLVADGREVVVPARQVSVEEAMMDEMQDRRTILR